MRVKYRLAVSLLAFSACQGVTGLVVEDGFEMGAASLQASRELFVEPKTVEKERRNFIEKLVRKDTDQRRLYEEYLKVIGANGILDGIEKVWPKCHSEAHDLGKVIFAQVHDVGNSLRVCADRCFSGCMHGVLMGAFAGAMEKSHPDGHVDLAVIKRSMNDLCYENPEMRSSHSLGDCAHGVGHALMFVTKYNIPEAVKACAEFPDRAMEYYCATGAYMEYVYERDAEDAKNQGFYYPCDTAYYPTACLRYKMVVISRRHYEAKRTTQELVQQCEKLPGKFRLGCFHGLGNAHMWPIAFRAIPIREVCGHGTDNERFMCIEGAMETMGTYHQQRALAVCEELEGKDRQTCLAAVERRLYHIKKDFSLYLGE